MAAKPNEIQILRTYDAPVKLVWEAWTDPAKAAKWWGPRGFTLTTKSKDFREGGKWIYTMHGPDGTDYPNIATYHEIVKYEKLVYDHGGNAERQKLFTVTVTFKEVKGKTEMNMIMARPTPEEAEATKTFIKKAGGNGTWDRLAEYLGNDGSGNEPFFINRSYTTDIETLFKMWADPDHLSKWMGPAGSRMAFMKVGTKVGDMTQYSMTSGGQTMYAQMTYKEITPPHRLVYTQNFCDKDGNLCKPPFAQTYPDLILTTVTFTEEGPHQARVTVKWEPVGKITDAERKTFDGMKAGMTQGWGGSLDKLEEVLVSRK